jgi:hypothetical protein
MMRVKGCVVKGADVLKGGVLKGGVLKGGVLNGRVEWGVLNGAQTTDNGAFGNFPDCCRVENDRPGGILDAAAATSWSYVCSTVTYSALF